MTLELGKSGIPLGAYEEGTGSGGGGGASELDQYLSGSTNASTTTLTVKNGKALDISAPTVAVGDNLVNNINGEDSQLYLKQGDIEPGENVTVVQTSTGVRISATGGSGGGTVNEKYGIEGDYATHYGIIDNPNGVIDYSINNKDIVVQQGLVLKCAGNGTAKSTIANNMPYTITSTGAITLFYANGNILECGKVDYSLTEPADNGTDNYQAWFNPDKTANPNQQWQFKSNDTGNVFRPVSSATPFADVVAGEVGITSVSYIGYRVIDDDIFAQLSDIEELEFKISELLDRVTALEDQGGGGSAPTVTFRSKGAIDKAGAVRNTATLQSEQIGSVDFGVSGSATAQ